MLRLTGQAVLGSNPSDVIALDFLREGVICMIKTFLVFFLLFKINFLLVVTVDGGMLT